MKKEIEQYDPDVPVIYDPKGYANEAQTEWWMVHHFRPCLQKAKISAALLHLEKWGPQVGEWMRRECESKNRDKAWVQIVENPAGCTELCQEIDMGPGQDIKSYIVKKCFKPWLKESKERIKNGKITMSQRRVLLQNWLAKAWRHHVATYDIVAAFSKERVRYLC